MQRVAFNTLGCKVNQYETEAMAEQFKGAGYTVVPFEEIADIYIINTCSVTGQAESKSCQTVRKAKRKNPLAVTVLTGCVAQVSPQEAADRTGADLVVGNSEKKEIITLIESHISRVGDIMAQNEYVNMDVGGHNGKTRGFIKIQDGCSNYCAYCIIPYARGKVRSRPVQSIVCEARRLVQNGFVEIVLVGIHLSSYGIDLENTTLVDVLKELHQIEGILRIRLGSLELASAVYDIAKNAADLPRLCPHFHISLQSGCDATLKRMRRKYDTAEYENALNMLRQAFADAAITTDIMVGFPGEDEGEFAESLDFAERMGFARAHIFPYSKRKGTPAAEMEGQVEKKVKEQRAKAMQEMASRAELAFLHKYIGKTVQVLFENPSVEGMFDGYTMNYAAVRVHCGEDIRKMLLDVKITGIDGDFLAGELI